VVSETADITPAGESGPVDGGEPGLDGVVESGSAGAGNAARVDIGGGAPANESANSPPETAGQSVSDGAVRLSEPGEHGPIGVDIEDLVESRQVTGGTHPGEGTATASRADNAGLAAEAGDKGPADADTAMVGSEQGLHDGQRPQDQVAAHVDGEAGESRLMTTLDQPEIKSAVDRAWRDSQAEDYESRHEEGGWLIGDDATGEARLERVPAGVRAGINPGSQPELGPGEHIEAFVHTHPNPQLDEKGYEWRQGLSDTDKIWSDRNQVPVVAKTATDLYVHFPRDASE
jgi:hypothetical protein